MEINKDITILKGSQFFLLINLKEENTVGDITPFDATGMMLRGQVRRRYDGVDSWDFRFNFIDLSVGEVEMIMDPDITETLDAGDNVYDVELYDPNDSALVYKVFYGKATVVEEVTRGN